MTSQSASSRPADALSGRIAVPGDKSISHRALMFGGIAIGETVIEGLLEGEDVLCTAAAMEQMGVEIIRPDHPGGDWRVFGRGVGGLSEPANVLDMGNSGTAARLLMGLVASHPFTTFFTGDASLNGRPMARVTGPLSKMGVSFQTRSNGRMPLAVIGSDQLVPIDYTLPVASAQVKSAVLLAGLNTMGQTTVVEPQPTRDHTERMLEHFGATIESLDTADGDRRITLTGQPELTGQNIRVPGDVSSAAFPLVAGLIVPGSELTVTGVGLNPLRAGLIETLKEMGAVLVLENERVEAGEPIADIKVTAGLLSGIEVPPERAPSMIDEYPVLAMAAACAEGSTCMTGLGELRVKESDRLDVVARGLEACGVSIEEGDDWLVVHGLGGTGNKPEGGATVPVHLDHRIAMSFLVLGMVSENTISVDDAAPITTSFPGFIDLMNGLGASITVG